MAAPKGNKYGVGGKGGGRPSKYKPEYAEQAYGIALLGATDAGVADVFGVSETTIRAWKKSHKAFLDALTKGKAVADSKIQESLFKRASGYEYTEVKTEGIVDDEGKASGKRITRTTKHNSPDTAAAFIWLKNRQPNDWRDKKEPTGDTDDTGVASIKIQIEDMRR